MICSSPPIVNIVGSKGSGKTDLIASLIGVLSLRGYRVAAVRHSPHAHETDGVGTDTYKFKEAGAIGAALLTSNTTNLFLSTAGWQEKLSSCSRAFCDCHIILMEGGIRNAREKIEIVPEGADIICRDDKNLRAIVGNGYVLDGIPCFSPDGIDNICSFIEENYLSPTLSSAVLAGGRSSRLGCNKALLRVGDTTIIERVIKTVSEFVPDIKIITNSEEEYEFLGMKTVPDIMPGCGPLSGIHAALSLSHSEYVLVVSCDIPLISPKYIRELIDIYPGADITIYKHKMFEPLCAIYRRTCIDVLKELIDHGEYRILDLFPSLNVRVLRIDAAESFRSINTLQDYEFILHRLLDSQAV